MTVSDWGTRSARAVLAIVNSGHKPANNLALNNSQMLNPTDIGDPVEFARQQQEAYDRMLREHERQYIEAYRLRWGKTMSPAQMAAGNKETHDRVNQAIANNHRQYENNRAKAFVQTLPP
jgi:hypothetical protein